MVGILLTKSFLSSKYRPFFFINVFMFSKGKITRHITRRTISLLSFLLILASCDKDGLPDTPSRTILIYMAGDNNLSSEVRKKLCAIRAGWKKCNGELLIYTDVRRKKAVLMRMRSGDSAEDTHLDTLAVYGEENSASAGVLNRVLNDVMTIYPANSYGMIYFSHASGWLPSGNLQNPLNTRSFGIDNNTETDSYEIELSDFAAAIPDGSLDFILFETCLTSGIEVAFALRNKADYLLMSSAEILSPGFNHTYRNHVMTLFNRSLTIQESLEQFAQQHFSHTNALEGAYRSATLSLIRTSEVEPLAILCREILKKKLLSDTTLDITAMQHFDRPGAYGDWPAVIRYFDFGETMKHITQPEEYKAFEIQLAKTVVWKASTPYFMMDTRNDGNKYKGFEINKHSGVNYLHRTLFPFRLE